MKNSGDNVFDSIPVGKNEASRLNRFLDSHDFAENTRKAIVQDVRKFARWFSAANHEAFVVSRVTVRDVSEFRDDARRNLRLPVSSINRRLVMLR